MNLHVITRTSGMEAALPTICSGDHLLFIDDGVWLLEREDALPEAVVSGCTLHALDPDLRARNITALNALAIDRTDDAGFVQLVVSCQQTLSW